MKPAELVDAPVLVAGAGISGLAAAAALVELGARVTVVDANPAALADLPEGAVAGAGEDVPSGTRLVVTGPGRRPDHALVAAAATAGVPVVGEPELAWWIGAASGEPPTWLVVTGTNGKTTTTGMLEAILLAAGMDAVACGNIGYPVVDAVRAGRRVLAVELSSFQLHWSPSVVPAAGCVLNVAEDHLDWHGSMAAYAAAKARALRGPVAAAGVDDPAAAALLAAAPAERKVGVTLGEPVPGRLGIVDGVLVDRAFAAAGAPRGSEVATPDVAKAAFGAFSAPKAAFATSGRADADDGVELARVTDVHPGGPPGLTDALAAAALARAAGVAPRDVAAGLAGFRPGRHRADLVATVAGVRYVDDSKATNPHAAAASLAAQAPAPVVWVVGGLLKGASVDELVAAHAGRLRAAVVIGTDRLTILAALARHAPDVPVVEVEGRHDGRMIPARTPEPPGGVMAAAVRRAAALARPGDVVLLAPAAASMDQFRDYAERGRAFAAAVAGLGAAAGVRGEGCERSERTEDTALREASTERSEGVR
ncbi:MAG: UDP-N-acetylmuramoyl-L-alanine--D-glutamate ligase [Pseudonocardia sp.]|nr:UDP-N-acetylmuramoyl-L-alanine--D-glutamate ligase [Pseudonocardia sp.]